MEVSAFSPWSWVTFNFSIFRCKNISELLLSSLLLSILSIDVDGYALRLLGITGVEFLVID